MPDIVTWLAEQFWGIFTGVIISLIVYFIVKLLPFEEDIRYKAIFYSRKILKILHDPKIKVVYVVKTQNLEEKKLKLDDAKKKILEELGRHGFIFKGELGNASIFNYILGKTEVEITLTPSYLVEGDEEKAELIVDYLQCGFRLTECRYRSFDGHLLDLIQIFRRLDTSLEDTVGKWIGESLTCDIKRLYEFVGVLKDLKMSSLSGKIGGQYQIELFENRLVVYGLIETTMTSMIKDIITYYY
jgi:hypothetical protein